MGGGDTRAESLERFVAEPELRLARTLEPDERSVVGTAQLGPEASRSLGIAGQLEPVGLGNGCRKLLADPGPVPPGEQLTGRPRVAVSRGEPSACSVSAADKLGAARQPMGLGARRGHRPEPLELARRLRQRERAVEQLPRITVAATGVDAAEHDERADHAGVGDARALDDRAAAATAASFHRPCSRAARALQPVM